MSGRSFGSLAMVATCAGAALGCYLVSLRVASERAALEQVETRIVLAQRDLRLLQTEIGTRGRLSQLERWNAGAFALSAPSADQFLRGSFELARLTQPDNKVDFQAPVVLATAQAPERPRALAGEPGTDETGAPAPAASSSLLHVASLKTGVEQRNIGTREVPAKTVVAEPQPAAPKSTDRPVTAAKPATVKSADRPGLAAAKPQLGKPAPKKPAQSQVSAAAKPAPKKSVDKPLAAATRPVTKPVRLAKADPLAPLPARQSGKARDSTADR